MDPNRDLRPIAPRPPDPRPPTCPTRRAHRTRLAPGPLLGLGVLLAGLAPGRVLAAPSAPAAPPASAPAPAPRRQEDPLAKLRAYLDRNPWHEGAFERLVQVAQDEDLLGLLEQDLRRQLDEDAAALAPRVLLARLRARGQAFGEALALLEDLDPPLAAQRHLQGQWLARVDRLEDAHAALLEAAELGADDPLLPGRALEEALRLALRIGDRERTLAAADALVALAPEDPDQHLHVADLLASGGRLVEARDRVRVALPLAGGDVEQELEALVLLASLEERSGRRDEALEATTRAVALLGPGHWRRAELFERRVELSRATGRLDELLEACALEVEARPADGDLRLQHARALQAVGRHDEALAALRAAAEALPDHVGLGRELARSLQEAGLGEEAVATYQALAARLPNERRLHLEAGLLLAARGEHEAAARQWDLELARAPRDLELRLELSGLHAAFGDPLRADGLLREALDERPGDLRPARALLERWDAGGPSSRGTQLLEELQRAARRRGDTHALQELATEWFAREDEERGQRALEEALACATDRRGILLALEWRLDPQRDAVRLLDVQRELIDLAPDVPTRFEAMRTYVEASQEARRLRSLTRDTRRPRREPPLDPVPSLLAGMALQLQGQSEHAWTWVTTLEGGGALQGYVEVWLRERRNEHELAAEGCEALVPGAGSVRERRDLWQAAARLYRAAGRADRALRAEEQLLAAAPDSAQVLTDLAAKRSRDPQAAAELLEKALRLNPHDGEARLALGRAYLRLDREARALEVLLPNLRSTDRAARRSSRELLAGHLLQLARLELEPATDERPALTTDTRTWDLDELFRVLGRVPQRWELGLLAVLQAREDHDHDRAAELLRELLQRQPGHEALVEVQEQLRGLTPELAPDDPPWVALEDSELRERLRIADALLERGDEAGARRVLRPVDDPVAEANTWLHRGRGYEAQRVLRRALARDRERAELYVRLATVFELEDQPTRAAQALDDALEYSVDRDGYAPWALRLRLARTSCARGPGPRSRAAIEGLFLGLQRSRTGEWSAEAGDSAYARRVREVARLLDTPHHRRAFLREARASLRDEPADPVLLRALLERLDPRERRLANRLLDDALEAGTPDGWTPSHWRALVAELREPFRSPRELEAEAGEETDAEPDAGTRSAEAPDAPDGG